MLNALYFRADWCGPCKTFGPSVESGHGSIPYEKVDVDTDDGMRLTGEYNVRSIPTLIILDGDRELGRLTGGASESAIASFFKQFSA